MARFDQAVNSFIAGELSPRVYGRADLPKYTQGVAEMYNMLPYIQGGTYRRPGSRYLVVNDNHAGYKGSWSILAASTGMRTFPLMMSDGTSYLIVITPGNPTVSNSDAGTDDHWQVIQVDSELNSGNCLLTNVNITGSTGFNGTGYTLAELSTLQSAQIGDFLIITCPTRPPVFFYKNVAGSPHNDGTVGMFIARGLETIPDAITTPYSGYANVYPFRDINLGNARGQGTLTSAAATGSGIVLTASVGIFLSTHVGSYFKLSSAGVTGIAVVVGYTSSTVVTVDIVGTVPTVAVGTAAGTSWEERAWSDARGWPSTVVGFQQRLIFGGCAAQPDTVWYSTQGNIFQFMARKFEQDPAFATAITNADAGSFTIASTEPNGIKWLSAGKSLFIGTLGREYVAQGSAGSLGPLDIEVNPESSYGSIASQPVRFDSALYYIQRSGQAIRQLIFNFMENAYKGDNILEDAEHLPYKAANQHATFSNPQIVQMAVQMNENPIFWAMDNNGGLMGGVLSPSDKVNAWSYHELGGSLSSEPAKVKSICTLRSKNGRNDTLYMVVNRTINSVSSLFIEFIGHEFASNNFQTMTTSADLDTKMIYSDCAYVSNISTLWGGSGTPATSWTGFTWLKNATVAVVADGTYIGTLVVDSSGVITTASAYTEIIVGLPYTSRITLLDDIPPSPVGSSIGQHKKINFVTMKFYRTISATFGRTTSLLESITFPTVGGLNTCDIRKSLPFGFDRSTSVVIQQAEPLPMAVSCVVMEGAANA